MTSSRKERQDDHSLLPDLRAEGSFLRQILDINPSLIFAKDREGRFTLVNKALADIYGTSVTELIGKTDADFNDDEAQVAFFREIDLKVMDNLEEIVVPEEVVTDSQGRRHWLHTVKRPIIGKDGKANQVLGVATDITHRRELEEELRQSRKMEALGLLAGGIAHDFNNLLAVVLGNTEWLLTRMKKQEGGDPDVQAVLELIQSTGERAASLINKLLAFGRRQKLHLEVIDLNESITDLATMLASLVGGRSELSITPSAESLHIYADRGQLEQVLVNLVVNARDAASEEGHIWIRTYHCVADGDEAVSDENSWKKDAVLEVRDDGIGIPPDVMDRIFEPFFTTKPPGKGTGLGLSTVYGIVRQFGGRVDVDSTPGKGTTFRVTIPCVEAAAVARQEQTVASPTRGSERILVCEDEASVLEHVRRTLAEEGYTVRAVQDPEEAVALCRDQGETFDLLLTDVIMPKMNGRQLVDAIKELQPGIKVLFMSGYAADVLGEDLSKDTSWITKPFKAEDLLHSVRVRLDR